MRLPPTAPQPPPTRTVCARRVGTDGTGRRDVASARNPEFPDLPCDARLAESAAEAAESVRAAQAKRWGSSALQRPWTPRCEIYLYPDGKAFAEATGQPESSPGFLDDGEQRKSVTTRKVILRADHPQLLTAILPHEVTHVVVADLFTAQQIPRWADEGIAVLAEPDAEQNLRAADLQESLASGQVFDLQQAHVDRLPRGQGLEPLLRPERVA